MELFLKPLTEASSYIFLSGIFMIILGALIGLSASVKAQSQKANNVLKPEKKMNLLKR